MNLPFWGKWFDKNNAAGERECDFSDARGKKT